MASIVGLIVSLGVPPVAGAAWQPAVPVPNAVADLRQDFVVASNVRGDAYAVWANRVDAYNSTLRGARRTAGGAWSAAFEVSDPAGSDPDPRPFITTGHNDDPAVAVAPNGETLVAWSKPAVSNQQTDPDSSDFVRVMIVPPGQATGPRVTVARGLTTRVEVAVGYDDQGNATLVWWDQYAVHAATRPAGGSFGIATKISRGDHVSYPRFAFAGNGAAAGILADADGLVAVVRDPSDTWRRLPLIQTPRSIQGLNVAMNDAGATVFAWSECADPDACGQGRLKAVHRPPGGQLGSAEVLASHWGNPALAVSVSGEATAVSHGVSAEMPLIAWTRPPGGTFGDGERVTTEYPGGAIAAAYDDAGGLHVGWNSYYGADPEVARPFVTMRPAGGAWATAHSPPGVPNLAAPAFAAGADGRMVALWASRREVHMADFIPSAEPPLGDPPPPIQGDDDPEDLGSTVGAQPNVSGNPDGGGGGATAGDGDQRADPPGTAGTRSNSGGHDVGPVVRAFARRFSAALGRSGVRRGRPRLWFVPSAEGRLTVTVSLGRTVVAVASRRVDGKALIVPRLRSAGYRRVRRALAAGRRPSLKLRVVWKPASGPAIRTTRAFRPRR